MPVACCEWLPVSGLIGGWWSEAAQERAEQSTGDRLLNSGALFPTGDCHSWRGHFTDRPLKGTRYALTWGNRDCYG